MTPVLTCTDVRRSSLQETYELLRLFEQTATTAHSKFHTEKAEANPAIFHAEGLSNGYEQARHAIERDLKHVMRSHTGREGLITYSIHYSDVNGLSKLENYILGLEIGKYFGKDLILFSPLSSCVVRLSCFRSYQCILLFFIQHPESKRILAAIDELNILGLNDKC